MGKDTNITWRQQNVEIAPNSVKDVFFLDTYPNAFYISNNNDTEIYISLTYTPTVERYEVELKRNDRDTFGRPTPTNRMYILNPSAKQISVTIFSAENMFDMALLKNFRVDIEQGTMEALAYDGVITGVKGGLNLPVEIMNPSDINLTIPSDLEVNATFPDDTSIGLSGDALNALLEVKTLFKHLTNNNVVTGFRNINDLYDSINAVKSAVDKLALNSSGISYCENLKSGNITATSTEVVFDFVEIDYVSNDGDNDITLTVTLVDGTTATQIIKSNNAISDQHIRGKKIKIDGTGTVNVNYALLG